MTRDSLLDDEIARLTRRLEQMAFRLAALAGVLNTLAHEHDQCLRDNEGEALAGLALQAVRIHDEQLRLLYGQLQERRSRLQQKRQRPA